MTKDISIQSDFLSKINSRSRRYFTLRMAPLIDVIFLLLIFFLVAAKWRPQEDFLPLQLPAARAQSIRYGKPEPLLIYIFAADIGCNVRIGQLETISIKNQSIEKDLLTLLDKMKSCMLAQNRFVTDPVEIISAADVKWEHLAKIYNLFYGSGLTDITFQMTGEE